MSCIYQILSSFPARVHFLSRPWTFQEIEHVSSNIFNSVFFFISMKTLKKEKHSLHNGTMALEGKSCMWGSVSRLMVTNMYFECRGHNAWFLVKNDDWGAAEKQLRIQWVKVGQNLQWTVQLIVNVWLSDQPLQIHLVLVLGTKNQVSVGSPNMCWENVSFVQESDPEPTRKGQHLATRLRVSSGGQRFSADQFAIWEMEHCFVPHDGLPFCCQATAVWNTVLCAWNTGLQISDRKGPAGKIHTRCWKFLNLPLFCVTKSWHKIGQKMLFT